MKLIKAFISSKKQVIALLSDVVVIIVAVALAFLLRFDGTIPQNKMENFLAFTLLSVATGIPLFFLNGLYKISWSYVSMTDLPIILRSVVLSVTTTGLFLYVFRNEQVFSGFPRSVLFIYGILIFLFISLTRSSKRFYWQIIKTDGLGSGKGEEVSKPALISKREIKTVLIIGGAGYIGSVLTKELLDAGHKVRIIDKFLYDKHSLDSLKKSPYLKIFKEDFLDIDAIKEKFINVDAVVHLGAIVGEAACLANKDLAIRTNYQGTIYLARLCKTLGIAHFIFISSCSTYGAEGDINELHEESIARPIDFYGETKIYAERELIRLAGSHFQPVILRLATVYGCSPRMRFDLVVNALTKKALLEKNISIFGENQWRPFVHVGDVAHAIRLCLTYYDKVRGEILNVGSGEENYQIKSIGKLIKKLIPDATITYLPDVRDERNYKVAFKKIDRLLNFKPTMNVSDGIKEIKGYIIKNKERNFEDRIYYNHLSITS